MNVIKEINAINDREIELGLAGTPGSWHQKYNNSPWIYYGGIPYKLSEGDVICIFSQWGEIDDIQLVRDEDTGESKGFGFLRYEDGRSAILAVDNMNGVEILGRIIRVDHKDNFVAPKLKKAEREALAEKGEKEDLEWRAGRSYENKELLNSFDIHSGVNVFDTADKSDVFDRPLDEKDIKKREKKERKESKKRKKEERKDEKLAKKMKLLYDQQIAKSKEEIMKGEVENTGASWRGRLDPLLRK